MPYESLNTCEPDLPDYSCVDCLDQEFGRVRSVGLIRKDYLEEILIDPTDKAKWDAGVAAGKIIIIPITAGAFDPGDPAQLKGYGDIKNYNGPREQTLTWFDPNYKTNYGFYNGLNDVKSWIPSFRTETQVHIFFKPAVFNAKNIVEDDIESVVVWNVSAKVTDKDLPANFNADTLTAVFECVVAP